MDLFARGLEESIPLGHRFSGRGSHCSTNSELPMGQAETSKPAGRRGHTQTRTRTWKMAMSAWANYSDLTRCGQKKPSMLPFFGGPSIQVGASVQHSLLDRKLEREREKGRLQRSKQVCVCVCRMTTHPMFRCKIGPSMRRKEFPEKSPTKPN